MEKKTRGIRNNNWLNIRRSSNNWQGKTKDQLDQKFVTFVTPEYGYRAAWKILESYRIYFATHGMQFNVRNIIRRWAPPGDGNNTEAYILTVCKLSGLDQFTSFNSPELEAGKLPQLMAAMACVENGIKLEEVDMNHIRKGYVLAFPEGYIR